MIPITRRQWDEIVYFKTFLRLDALGIPRKSFQDHWQRYMEDGYSRDDAFEQALKLYVLVIDHCLVCGTSGECQAYELFHGECLHHARQMTLAISPDAPQNGWQLVDTTAEPPLSTISTSVTVTVSEKT